MTWLQNKRLLLSLLLLQYCQLYALTALFAAGATGSPEFLGPFATASWVRPEAHLAAGMHFFMKGQFEEALSSFQKMEPIESGVITAVGASTTFQLQLDGFLLFQN